LEDRVDRIFRADAVSIHDVAALLWFISFVLAVIFTCVDPDVLMKFQFALA
jgi:hypothetical protein